MKFEVTRFFSVVEQNYLYRALCSGCPTWVEAEEIESSYQKEDIKSLISVHWSQKHSPRARQLLGK